MPHASLPFIDEHRIDVAADVDDVWSVLLDTLDRTGSRRGVTGYATLVGSADRRASGPRPLAEGSTIPGFRVAAAAPGAELVLEGSHRFSRYALIFHLDRVGAGRSRLRAESRAAFPGLTGRMYRLLVIGTRGHGVAVRRLLSGVRRESELRV
jgi:hypothetical protein